MSVTGDVSKLVSTVRVEEVDESVGYVALYPTIFMLTEKWAQYDDVDFGWLHDRSSALLAFENCVAAHVFKTVCLYLIEAVQKLELPIPRIVSLSLDEHNPRHDYKQRMPRASFAPSFVFFAKLLRDCPVEDMEDISMAELVEVGKHVAREVGKASNVFSTVGFDPISFEIWCILCHGK